MVKKKSILDSTILYTFIAILVGFLIGAVFLIIARISPLVAYEKLLGSIFGRPKYLVWTLVYASPLILTGLSVAFSFKTGVFNIGAEGQFVVGSLAACTVGILFKMPPVIHAIVCMLAAAAAGFVWAMIVGILKVKKGIHEVLSFIMFNWLAFYMSNYVVNLPAIHKEGGGEATKDVLESARILFPKALRDALDTKTANFGIIIAVIAAIAIWIIIEKTTLGYRLKAVGYNQHAAKFAGINSDRSVLTALGISGMLAGLGGAVQLLGMSGRLSQFAGQEGYGFQGITVALIGSSHPLGCIFAGLFYGAMKYGGSKLSMVKAPSEVVDIIMGCIILVIAISHIFRILFKNVAKRKEAK